MEPVECYSAHLSTSDTNDQWLHTPSYTCVASDMFRYLSALLVELLGVAPVSTATRCLAMDVVSMKRLLSAE